MFLLVPLKGTKTKSVHPRTSQAYNTQGVKILRPVCSHTLIACVDSKDSVT